MFDAAVSMGRAAADARMTSRCTIRRKTGVTIVDGQEVPVWTVIYTDLPCRIASSPSAARSRTQRPGDAELERATPHSHFPASASDLRDNDLQEVTSGENSGDVLQLLETDWTDQATARRIPVMAVERPTEWGTP